MNAEYNYKDDYNNADLEYLEDKSRMYDSSWSKMNYKEYLWELLVAIKNKDLFSDIDYKDLHSSQKYELAENIKQISYNLEEIAIYLKKALPIIEKISTSLQKIDHDSLKQEIEIKEQTNQGISNKLEKIYSKSFETIEDKIKFVEERMKQIGSVSKQSFND